MLYHIIHLYFENIWCIVYELKPKICPEIFPSPFSKLNFIVNGYKPNDCEITRIY